MDGFIQICFESHHAVFLTPCCVSCQKPRLFICSHVAQVEIV